jgi:antitoxin component YwqK of YwqJK toxin-antitoxin module
VSLFLLSELFQTSITNAEEIYKAYCHEATGECFYEEDRPIPITELKDYETIFVNAPPVKEVDLKEKSTEKEAEQKIHMDEGILMLLMAQRKKLGTPLKFFRYVGEYPNGQKELDYTGYGASRLTIECLHGKFTEWYQTGGKKKEIDYKWGKVWGKVKVWYPNGAKKEESEYRSSKLHGVSKLYDENGELVYKDTYKDGEKTNRKAYSPEGRLIFDQSY